MLSGALNPENLSQTLRDISQRRRQGVLEVSLAERQIHVQFIQGRVVDVLEIGLNPYQEVVEILERISVIPQTIAGELDCDSYQDLFLRLNQVATLDESVYRQVLKHRVLERLYELESVSGGFFGFQVRMVECDREFAPAISVGQLLLDLVSLRADAARFDETFPPGCILQLTGHADEILGEEEKIVLDLVKDGISIELLREKCLLSSFHFHDALLSLKDHGLIKNGQAAQTCEARDAFDLDNLAQAFEDSIDEAFAHPTPQGHARPEPAVTNGVSTHAELSAESAELANTIKQISTAAAIPFKIRLNLLNLRLLQASWVPALITLALLASALLAPFVMWKKMLAMF